MGRRGIGAALGLGLAGSPSGCTVDSLDLSGRPCPCLPDWECNPDTQTCERAGDDDSGDGASGDGASDVAPFDGIELSADWSTPTAIHWAWTLTGDAADFHAYELWVATSASALDGGTDVRVFDGATNPELSRWILNNTNDPEPVLGTITDGLEPGVEYFARLFVLDTAGGRTPSDNVAVRATMMTPVSDYLVYGDEPTGNGNLPWCMTRTDTAPAAGSTHHYAHVMQCDPDNGSGCEGGGAPECWENLRLHNIEGPSLTLGDGEFAGAFLEAYVAIDGAAADAHGWWSEIGIQSAGDSWHNYKGMTLRADGTYRRYEIPLTQLGLTADTFDGTVTGFRVGSTFPDATTVRFDEVRIRW